MKDLLDIYYERAEDIVKRAETLYIEVT